MPTQDVTRYAAACSTALAPVVLGPPRCGRVLGASPSGLYLCFDESSVASFDDAGGAPAVIALLPAVSVRLPLAMVTSDPLPTLRADDPIVVGDGVLHAGGHSWRTVRWFEPRPPAFRRPLAHLLAEAAESLWNLSESDVGLSAQEAWNAAAALAAGDPGPSRALLGGGPGLTPAGDDVVAGAMAVCALSGAGPHRHETATLLARARVATTALSAALLGCAAEGRIIPEAAGLLRALSGGAPLPPALGHLRAVGSTSGTALAIGMVAALAASELDPSNTLNDGFGVTERLPSWAVAP
jgi:hypothetical protein